ncbi:MAG: helix-hairpin-helix domain-containing protein [Candidatus Omnitrophica bacterium]|nr:helix-hairpin-helix domain-containing protein [Candidatus Omnitrophota bacterium]
MFEFNRQEKRVIIFLLMLMLTGQGITFFCKRSIPCKTFACVNRDLGKIDINAAEEDVLVILPGIGEKLARRIVDYRKERGQIEDIEELAAVKGLSPARVERLKEYIFVR